METPTESDGQSRRGRSEGSKRTQFKAGQPRAAPIPIPVQDSAVQDFDRLAAMRRALAGQAATEAEKALKAMLKRSPDKFFDTYDRLEAEDKAAKAAATALASGHDAADAAEADDSNERLRREIEHLWNRWFEKRGTWPPPPKLQGKIEGRG